MSPLALPTDRLVFHGPSLTPPGIAPRNTKNHVANRPSATPITNVARILSAVFMVRVPQRHFSSQNSPARPRRYPASDRRARQPDRRDNSALSGPDRGE